MNWVAVVTTAGSLAAAGVFAQNQGSDPTPCPPSPGVFRGGPLPAPSKLVHVDPVFPERQRPTRIGRQLWIGEAEIGVDGKVRSVKVVRKVSLDPPWPEWEEAIPAAVRQWRFSLTCLLGKPQRVFMTIVFDPAARQFRSQEPRPQRSEPPAQRPPNNQLQRTKPAQAMELRR